MKTFLFSAAIVLIILSCVNGVFAQANTALSNLVAPTKVNVNLLPNTTNTKDLGSAGKSWRNIYVQADYFLGGIRFISGKGLANTFVGSNAALSNSSGDNNTVIGYQALFSNTTGSTNVAVGTNTLYYNTTGYSNTAS